MGKLITKKIRGMNLWAKVALTVLFTFVLSVFMYEGWYKPLQVQAATVTYQASVPDTSTSLGADGTCNTTSGAPNSVTANLKDTMSTTYTTSASRYYPTTGLVNGTTTSIAKFYGPVYASNTTITAPSASIAIRGYNATDQWTFHLYEYDPAGAAGNKRLLATSSTIVSGTGATVAAAPTYVLEANNVVASGHRLMMEVTYRPGGTTLTPRLYLDGTASTSWTRLTVTETAVTTPTVQWTAASQGSANESGTMTVTAQLSSAAASAVTVPFTVTGTATSGTDYTITASPITIAAGNTTGTATVTITSDTTVEPNETVILTMGTPTNATLGTTTVHTATITNDDVAIPTVNWTAASQASAAESGTMTVTAQLSGTYTSAVTVPFTVTGTATNGTDYTVTASPITIAAGNTTGSATITITGDTTIEPNETVILTIGTPTNATLGATTVHTATITNDDLPTVQWTAASQASAAESGTMTVTAQLSATYTSAVTVPYTVTGTATNGTDYTITASPITIAAGNTTGSATITITGDTTVEPNETVIVTMGTPTNATLGATTVHTATITNDDSAAVNSTAAGTATAVAVSSTSITVTAPYTNDSNGNNTLKVEWGTGGTYALGNQTAPHAVSPYVFNISGLTASTAYNVRVTYQDADTVTGTAVQTFTPSTPAYSSPLMHTAANVNPGNTKGYGATWGSTFTCETCHAQGTTNVKLIATSVDTPNGLRNVIFTRMTSTSNSQNGVFGNDQRTYAGNGTGGSSNICEVCHRQTAFHRYSTNAPTLTHYNNQLCITCHTHAFGFKATGGHVVPMFATTDGHTGCASGIGCHTNSDPGASYPTAGTAPDCRSCHAKADPTVATNGCGSCHGAANGNGEPVGTVHPDNAGSHAVHTGIPTACTVCHDTGGTGGNADHGKGNRGANPAVVNLAASFTWNGTTCSTTTCHANVYGTGSVTTPVWGSTGNGCSACHSVAIGANGPATGSHTLHAGTACTACHAAGTSQTTTPSTGHTDGDIDVINGYPANVTKHAAGTYTGSCSTSTCHGATSPTWGANTANATCTKCHGTPSPVASNANMAPSVGAHQVHVRGTGTNSYSRELTCYECHNSGSTISFTNHMNGNTQNVVFTNASTARDNGATVSWTAGTYPNGTCSVYCHGVAMPKGDTSGTAKTPSWTANLMTGVAANDCNLCHGNPPTTGSTVGIHTSDVSQPTSSCTTCHIHFNGSAGFDSEANRRLHIDGLLQAKNDCDTCHAYDTVGATKDVSNVWSGGYWGKSPKSAPNAYGEHAKHINYIKTRLGYTGALNAVAQTYGAAGSDGVKVCGTCHSVDPAAHTTDNSSARSIFPSGHPYLMGGTGGTSLLFGTSNPAYSVAGKTCSNISCHYFTTPTW